MGSRYCTSCGTPSRADTRFCTLCGATVEPPDNDRSGAPVTHAERAPAWQTAPPPPPPPPTTRRGRWIATGIGAAVILLVAAIAAAVVTRNTDAADTADLVGTSTPTATITVRTSSPAPTTSSAPDTAIRANATSPPLVRRTELLGYSVRGRRIVAIELGDPNAPKTVLVIGCVHGDECAGVAVAKALKQTRPPADVHVWLIPNLNPDGYALGTRQNANGVDLNRNSAYDWQSLGSPGDREYSGNRSLSEPEARIVTSLIERVKPDITFWFHQRATADRPPLIDDSGGRADIESRYATLVGLPFERKPRYPGSLASWSNWKFAGTTAFVIELRGKRAMTAAEVRRHAAAVYAVTKKL